MTRGLRSLRPRALHGKRGPAFDRLGIFVARHAGWPHAQIEKCGAGFIDSFAAGPPTYEASSIALVLTAPRHGFRIPGTMRYAVFVKTHIESVAKWCV